MRKMSQKTKKKKNLNFERTEISFTFKFSSLFIVRFVACIFSIWWIFFLILFSCWLAAIHWYLLGAHLSWRTHKLCSHPVEINVRNLRVDFVNREEYETRKQNYACVCSCSLARADTPTLFLALIDPNAISRLSRFFHIIVNLWSVRVRWNQDKAHGGCCRQKLYYELTNRRWVYLVAKFVFCLLSRSYTLLRIHTRWIRLPDNSCSSKNKNLQFN